MAKRYYPLPAQGKIIGRPYQGTHTLFGNWESDNAVDISTPVGTPVYAVANGTIGSQIGSLGSKDPKLAGLRVHLVSSGNEFYYQHLSKLFVHAGQHVSAGQIIGYSGSANGVAHLHFAAKKGNPLDLLKNDIFSSQTNIAGTRGQAEDTGATGTNANDQTVTPTTTDESGSNISSQLSSAIANIPQASGGAPLFQTPLAGDQADTSLMPVQSSSNQTWQLIATQGQVSQDTLRLASLASLASNASGINPPQ